LDYPNCRKCITRKEIKVILLANYALNPPTHPVFVNSAHPLFNEKRVKNSPSFLREKGCALSLPKGGG